MVAVVRNADAGPDELNTRCDVQLIHPEGKRLFQLISRKCRRYGEQIVLIACPGAVRTLRQSFVELKRRDLLVKIPGKRLQDLSIALEQFLDGSCVKQLRLVFACHRHSFLTRARRHDESQIQLWTSRHCSGYTLGAQGLAERIALSCEVLKHYRHVV